MRFRAGSPLLWLLILGQGLLAMLGSLVAAPPAGSEPAPAAKPPESVVPQGIVVRATENVTNGGWVWLLNQCQALGIKRIDLLVKQDEDNFLSPRTGRTLQSGELLVALPGETTAAGWENSEWLTEMLARAREMRIEVWAWWPCFHDAQMATAFPRAAYSSSRGERFVDAAEPAVQARQEALLAKLLKAYWFDGVSFDWLRYNSWPDGSAGPLGEAFARRFDFRWDPASLQNDYLKARWYEARSTAIADWVARTTRSLRESNPGVRFGAFLLPPQFTEASQNYPMLSHAGLDFLQPMTYWTDWKQPPQWVGEGIISPFSRAPANGTAFWPTLGINSPAEEIAVALRSLPMSALGGMSWFNYGAWEQKTFDKLRDVLCSNVPTPVVPAAPLTGLPASKTAQPKEFPADASVWSVVCLGELYKRGALAERNGDPVCPVLAFHTFADAGISTAPFLYKCSTGYLDALLQAVADAAFRSRRSRASKASCSRATPPCCRHGRW